MSVICAFHPTGLGKFSIETNLLLMNKNYKIPIKLYGTSLEIAKKMKKVRGIESFKADYEEKL